MCLVVLFFPEHKRINKDIMGKELHRVYLFSQIIPRTSYSNEHQQGVDP